MRIRFIIEYFVSQGEVLHIYGSSPLLGSNDSNRSVAMHQTSDGYWEAEVMLPDEGGTLRYSYLVKSGTDVVRCEWGVHTLDLDGDAAYIRVFDRWADIPQERYYSSSAFTEAVFARRERTAKVLPAKNRLILSVEAPSLRPGHRLVVTGDCEELGCWDPKRAVVMSDADAPVWTAALDMSKLHCPFEYKFVVTDAASGETVAWECGRNRRYDYPADKRSACTVVAGLRLCDPLPAWHGAGTAIPVFSLRSERSFGTGEFADLKLMVDWAVATGQRMIQILPIHDTTMYGSWQDSYPYNANSTFALHPQYLHIPSVGCLSETSQSEYESLQRELNSLSEIDYVRVNEAKQRYLRELFAADGSKTLSGTEFKQFMADNRSWLIPYSAYCALRDRFGTPEFSQWGDYAHYDAKSVENAVAEGGELHDAAAFSWFVQYHLHLQLSDVRDYAHAHGVVLKGDIPIGVSRTSADAWASPELFNMDCQAGAPPDDFSVTGQNWGFPTYNWERMAADGYAWWRARFSNMAKYFDAYRIDHILGFFRIWEIPDGAVHGLLGHFNPALPYTADELRKLGLWFNRQRHAEPYIYEHMLKDIFGRYAADARSYMDIDDCGRCVLHDRVSTQRRVTDFFAGRTDECSYRLRDGFMRITEDVLFVEDTHRPGMFHPRIASHDTYSYRALSESERHIYDRIYDDFFYRRHDRFWRDTAMHRLPPLISATDMLVCGEDLGMIPHCVPEVMDTLRILSLEIERMPKQFGVEFGDTRTYPYLSVCTASTHDMTPIRAWWEEDRQKTRRYYSQMLDGDGEAPYYCEPWVCERIVESHLASSSMLTVLPLQDWLSIDVDIRRADPHEERINIPADSRHYWRYRMHLTLEELLAADSFNAHLRRMIADSGRA